MNKRNFDKLHGPHVCKLSAKRTIPDASVKGESLTKKKGGGAMCNCNVLKYLLHCLKHESDKTRGDRGFI